MEIRPPDIAPDAGPPAPRDKSAVAFFSVVLTLYAFLGSVAQARHPALGLAWTEVFVFLLPAVAASAGSNLDPASFLLLRRRRPLEIALGAGVGGALFLVASGVMTLTTLALPQRWVEAFDLTHLFAGPGRERLSMALLASIVAPLAEEVAFRGYALSALRTWARPWPSIAASAVLFAVMHLDPVRFPAVLLLGVAFGWLAWRSGSLWPAVAAHAVNNALGSAVVAGAGGEPAQDADLLGALGILSVGLAALAPLAFLYWRATPEPPPPGRSHVLRDPGDPSIRFRLGRVPRAFLFAALVGLLAFLALAAGATPLPAR